MTFFGKRPWRALNQEAKHHEIHKIGYALPIIGPKAFEW